MMCIGFKNFFIQLTVFNIHLHLKFTIRLGMIYFEEFAN